MRLPRVFALALVAALLLFGCSQDNLDDDGDVTSIHVFEWDTDNVVTVIEDDALIDDLVSDLDGARTATTADLDFAMPEYWLAFRDDDEVLFEFGYFTEVMDLKVEGRYWNFNDDEMYEVERQLPLE